MAADRDTPHILTFEVEEYYQDVAFRDVVPPAEWTALPTRVDRAVARTLEVLERFDTEATFFVDEWVARTSPDLVADIHAAGHEVASRGKAGAKVDGRSNGRSKVDRVTVAAVEAKEVLEELAGAPIWGHRAAQQVSPAFRDELCDRLHRIGFRYDSSLSEEVRRSRSDMGNAPPGVARGYAPFLELPRAETRVLGLSLGPLGGANFRQLPYSLTRRSFVQHTEQEEPVVFGLRSWELDRFQPELPGGAWSRFRHYHGLERTESRLERLLAEFRFTSAREWLELDAGGLEPEGKERPERRTDTKGANRRTG